ncbi:MAG: hypothetical protein N2C14_16925 [Planctomycetales bacterium]
MVTPSFSVDLAAFRAVLDKVVDFGWDAHGDPEHAVPYVWLEGSHAGHDVLIRVLAFALRDEEPGWRVRGIAPH